MPRSFSARGGRAVVALALAPLLVACGGGAGSGSARRFDSSTEAHIAARAADPRTNDPTAARTPFPASQGSASLLGPSPSQSGAPPASFGAAQPSKAPPGGASPPSSEPASGETAPAADGSAAASADAATAPPRAKRDTEPPKKIGARHILIQWMGAERAPASVVRSREQAYAVAQQVLKRAKAGEDFARLAIEFSDEPGAGPRGGSLGRFGRGQMVPAFEEAAFKLEVGEISDIVESPFGYHIIQRTE